MSRLPFLLASAGFALLPVGVSAQTLQIPLGNSSIVPQTAPTSTPSPSPVVTPTPLPSSPPPSPTATAAPIAPRPAATATSAPRVRPSPILSDVVPTPAALPTEAAPTPINSATPQPTASASPRPPIETVVVPQTSPGAPIWPWLVGGTVLLLGLALLLARRRTAPVEQWEEEPAAEVAPPAVKPPVPTPAPAPGPAMFARTPAPTSAAPVGGSRLAIELRPARAGLNMLTATIDAEVTVTNIGTRPARDIRADVALFAAHRPDEPDLARIAATPVARPTVPPFSLAPGEERRFRAIAALPLAAIEPLKAGGRPIFVPLVTAQLRWRDDGGERGAAQAWAVGVERVDSAKLAPIWLDQAGRSYDAVAARVSGEIVER